MTQSLAFIDSLSPTQEHFLKKFLVEACLKKELESLKQPYFFPLLGAPFTALPDGRRVLVPLLQYFFRRFVASFPFITMNPQTDQIAFWRDTVQPFVESFNRKRVLGAGQRRENTTKRRQANQQLLRTLLLFYNSMLSLRTEVTYLQLAHLKPSDQGKLDKLLRAPALVKVSLEAFHAPASLTDYPKMAYTNNYNINIVAVDVFRQAAPAPAKGPWLLNPLRLVTQKRHTSPAWHCVFILQVTRRTVQNGELRYDSHFVARRYSEFRLLEQALKARFPGLMSTEVRAMPAKFKHDLGVPEACSPGSPRSDSSSAAYGGNSGSWGKDPALATRGSGDSESTEVDTAYGGAQAADLDPLLAPEPLDSPRHNVPFAEARESGDSPSTFELRSVDSAGCNAPGSHSSHSGSLKKNSPKSSERSDDTLPKPSTTFGTPGSLNSSTKLGALVSSSARTRRDHTHKYRFEKLRMALRGYLNTLLHKREIATCQPFLRFLDDPELNFAELSPEQTRDYEQRAELERLRLVTQEEFQTHIAGVVYDLSQNFEGFKSALLTDPHQLSAIFEEIGRNPNPSGISPLITSFLEWCKLEIAATLYQMFLTQDNSSQLLQKCRKFHRLFPYRMCYGILKYTNPVKIMLRMVDLLLMNVPSFGRHQGQTHNLLSMIFIMLLDEDLEDFSKERRKLLNTLPLDLPEYKVFLQRISSYVSAGDADLEHDLQQESIKNGTSFLLAVLSSDLVEPCLSMPERVIFDQVIRPSFDNYQRLESEEALDGASVYVTMKQYWQLEIRTRDKEIFKQLWKEPELTQLIKKVLTVIYQPLMTVMKKCNVHFVFRDFQHFVDDLLTELTTLDEGDMYFTSSVEMFNRFKKLLDRYEGTFYRFLHDLHNKDDGKLFLKLIAWIESFLIALRTKFSEPERVRLNFSAMVPTAQVDADKFYKDLNARTELILKKRFLLKNCLEAAATAADADVTTRAGDPSQNKSKRVLSSHQKAIDHQWDKLNDGLFEMQPQELGVSGDDLEDFNLNHLGEKAAHAYRGGQGNAHVLQQIADLDQRMNELADTEIHKLVEPTHAQIKEILENLAAS